MSDIEWGPEIRHDFMGQPNGLDAHESVQIKWENHEDWDWITWRAASLSEIPNVWMKSKPYRSVAVYRLRADHPIYQIPANQGFPTSELTAEVVEWKPDQRTLTEAIQACIHVEQTVPGTDERSTWLRDGARCCVSALRALLKSPDPDEEAVDEIVKRFWMTADALSGDGLIKKTIRAALAKGRAMERGK